MGCPVCGNDELILISENWETCPACSARWVHREPGDAMVLLLPSKEQADAARDRLEPDGHIQHALLILEQATDDDLGAWGSPLGARGASRNRIGRLECPLAGGRRLVMEATPVGGSSRDLPPSRARWFCPKPTVKILFYTDSSPVSLDGDIGANEFGVRILRDMLEGDDSDRATFKVSLLDRHAGGHASNKLTSEVLGQYDQVWFFGLLQANRPSQPANELTDPEVEVLAHWMSTGGVLMTGDHANPRFPDADPGLDPLLGLGRAIGHRVPRAGLLRKWEGNPAQFDEGDVLAFAGFDQLLGREPIFNYTYNTQVPTGKAHVDSLDLQEDEVPQRLILTTYPDPSDPLGPSPVESRHVHPLFCGREAPITVFPDHMHEGALVLPQQYPQDIWPSGPSGQPRPEVVARGTDKRTGGVYNIVSAYDGSPAGVGRIVADSTWHHYFNVNLKGFHAGGAVLTPLATQLATFYANLAIWLSPPEKRAAIACWQRSKLLINASVQMAYGNPRIVLGRVAADVLRRTAGPCMIRQVFDPIALSSGMADQDVVAPPEELVLGGVLHAFLEAFERADAGEDPERLEGNNDLIRRGVRAAYDDLSNALGISLSRAQRGREQFEERQESAGSEASD
jgi:hypothetical protein